MTSPVGTPVQLASVEHSETSFEEIDELVSPINPWVDLRRKFLEVLEQFPQFFLTQEGTRHCKVCPYSKSDEKGKIGPIRRFHRIPIRTIS